MSGQEFYKTNDGYAAMLATHGEAHFAPYLAKVAKLIPPGVRLLDLGCGTGVSSRLLADRGWTVTGSDLSEKFLDRKLEGRGLTLRAADALQLPFGPGAFDAVASYCFIEHVPDVQRVVDEMIRVTKPGGTILVLSPNLLSPFLALKSLGARLRGRELAGVFPPTIGGHLAAVVRSAALSKMKVLFGRPGILVRTPDHTRPDVADADSTWWCTQIDLVRAFRRRGVPARMAVEGYSPAGRAIAALLPWFAGECGVVARPAAIESPR